MAEYNCFEFRLDVAESSADAGGSFEIMGLWNIEFRYWHYVTVTRIAFGNGCMENGVWTFMEDSRLEEKFTGAGVAHCIHFKQYLLFIRCLLCGFGHSEISDISIFMWRLHANESNSKF